MHSWLHGVGRLSLLQRLARHSLWQQVLQQLSVNVSLRVAFSRVAVILSDLIIWLTPPIQRTTAYIGPDLQWFLIIDLYTTLCTYVFNFSKRFLTNHCFAFGLPTRTTIVTSETLCIFTYLDCCVEYINTFILNTTTNFNQTLIIAFYEYTEGRKVCNLV